MGAERGCAFVSATAGTSTAELTDCRIPQPAAQPATSLRTERATRRAPSAAPSIRAHLGPASPLRVRASPRAPRLARRAVSRDVTIARVKHHRFQISWRYRRTPARRRRAAHAAHRPAGILLSGVWGCRHRRPSCRSSHPARPSSWLSSTITSPRAASWWLSRYRGRDQDRSSRPDLHGRATAAVVSRPHLHGAADTDLQASAGGGPREAWCFGSSTLLAAISGREIAVPNPPSPSCCGSSLLRQRGEEEDSQLLRPQTFLASAYDGYVRQALVRRGTSAVRHWGG
eukprot:COSAG01_NODE_70_length_28755_cov_34.709067_18_plen_286_part_00